MKLDKNAKPEITAPVKPKKEKKPKSPLRLAPLGALLGLLLAFALSAFVSQQVYQNQIVNLRQQQLQELTQQQADLLAQDVQTYFDGVQSKIAFLIGNSLLRSALETDDKNALELYQANFKKQLDDVIAVSFFKKGTAKLNADIYPPIRFSELELFRRVEAGNAVAPEAVNIGDQWLLHYVAPIHSSESNAELVGFVWLSSGNKKIPDILSTDASGLGKVELVQKFSERSQFVIAAAGNANLSTSASAQLGNTPWEVRFTASQKLYEQTYAATTVPYLIMAAVLTFSVALFAGGFWFIGNNMDGVRRRRLLSQRMSGAPISKSGESGEEYVDPMYQTRSILDVNIKQSDEELLGLDDDEPQTAGVITEELEIDDDVFEMESADANAQGIPDEVFRAYDIRGLAGEQIDKKFAQKLGQALGSEALDQRIDTLVVARDARIHSPELTEWLVRGILSTGCNVINIGTVPTPLLYFALETLEGVNSGVMVTASHNAAKYAGFKIVLNGVTRSGTDIKALRTRILKGKFYSGQGQEHRHDVVASYIDTIFSDVALAGEMSVVVDAGNAVPGLVAPKLFEELGCRVIPLYCDLDGHFPNHDPDPSRTENLQDLIKKVKEEQADIGIALDGDGDRLAVVTPKGEIIWADRLLMAFTKDIISRNPGADVVFDVKCSRHLNTCITNYGGRPIMWKTGHALMKEKMVQSGALVGGEYSGHIFIKDRWFGFDDGMYAAARLLEIVSLSGDDADALFDEFPVSLVTPEIRIEVGEKRKFEIVEQLIEKGDFGDGRKTLLDGIRVDYANGWGLVRASNTGPEITLRFEADDETAMHSLKAAFVKELRMVDNTIQVDWNNY